MVHVSKKSLDKKIEKDLFSQFSYLFSNVDQTKAAETLRSILTPAEQIMLMKRVAIVFMLAEDFSTYKIAKTLKVSDSTVRVIRQQYKKQEFNLLTKKFSQPGFDKEKFWETLDKLLRLGMPPMGKGRWSYLNKR